MDRISGDTDDLQRIAEPRGDEAKSLIPRIPSFFAYFVDRAGKASSPDSRIANISLREYHLIQRGKDLL
ncbi:MAG: hypothetical protein WBM17_15860 [Anaerolineales bacterium]